MTAIWRSIKIGGGGYVTGIDASSDGSTIVCRTDTYGGYIWNATTGSWDQLILSTSIPDATAQYPILAKGIVELRVAPSDPNRLYMAFMGDIWKSTDRGVTWTETNANWNNVNDSNANATPRFMGQKMAIDPANPDVVYFGTPSAGVIKTVDGGVNWTAVSTSDIPACATAFSGINPGHSGICFDPTSGTTGGKTNIIFIPVYGTGVYQSTDAGATWAAMSGAPTKVRHARVASDGFYYVANVDAAVANQLFRWNGTVWAAKGPAARGTDSVIIDPSNAARLIAVHDDGSLQLSLDRGDNWQTNTTISRSATHIPWMAWTREVFMSVGDCIFDPVVPDKIWFAEGIGVWTTTFSGSPSSVVWSEETVGIENLSSNEVIVPPGGKPLCANWDRSVFRIDDPEVFPSTHSPDNPPTLSIRMAWDIDYATSDPNFVAYPSVFNLAADNHFGWKSADGGQTWTALSVIPSGGTCPIDPPGSADKTGACIAVSTPLNFIIVPSNNALPWYTKDGGATWTEIVIPGIPREFTGDLTSGSKIITNVSIDTSNLVVNLQFSAISGFLPVCNLSSIDSPTQITVSQNATNSGTGKNFIPETGFGNAFFNHNKCVAADKVTAGTFYLYNYLTKRIYRSTDQGDNWTQMNAVQVTTGTAVNQAILKAVPGQSGHIFLAGGLSGNPSDANPGGTRLWRSIDGGATITEVAGGTIREPQSVGFGAAASGQSYPSVVFQGWRNSTWGVWVSYDNCASWANIGGFPNGWFGAGRSIDGDKSISGKFYTVLAGASFAYYSDPDAETVNTGGGSYLSPEELAAVRRYWEELETGRELNRKKREEIEDRLSRTIEAAYDKAMGIEPEAAKAIAAVVPKAALLPAPEIVKSKVAKPTIDWSRVAKDIDAVDRILQVLGKQIDRLDDKAKLSAAQKGKLDRLRKDEQDIELLMMAL